MIDVKLFVRRHLISINKSLQCQHFVTVKAKVITNVSNSGKPAGQTALCFALFRYINAFS